MNTCYIKYEPILLELKKYKYTMVSLNTDWGPNDLAGDKNCRNKLKFCQLEIFKKPTFFRLLENRDFLYRLSHPSWLNELGISFAKIIHNILYFIHGHGEKKDFYHTLNSLFQIRIFYWDSYELGTLLALAVLVSNIFCFYSASPRRQNDDLCSAPPHKNSLF